MRIFVHELRGELQLYSRSRELAFFTFMERASRQRALSS